MNEQDRSIRKNHLIQRLEVVTFLQFLFFKNTVFVFETNIFIIVKVRNWSIILFNLS